MDILRKQHSGQVALIMVLIMTVISAVAVSMAGRATVETSVQEVDTQSSEAMLAASAGLEQASIAESNLSGVLETGKGFNVTVDTEGTNGVLSDKINPGQTLDVNLSGATGLTGVRVYWSPASSQDNPSLFISDVRTDRIVDYAYDSVGANGFTKVSSGGNLNGTLFSYVIPAPISLSAATEKELRIVVLGGAAFVGVEPIGGSLPPQTRTYRSVGSVERGDSSVKYGIEYKESATDEVPSVFDYALFASGSIIQ